MNCIKSVFLLAVFVFTGCTTVEEQKLPVYGANTILLLPVKSLHKELKTSEPSVDLVLKSQFEKTKFNIITLTTAEYERANKEALEISGSVYKPDVGDYVPLNTRLYASSLKNILADKYSFDTLVLASLLLREAKLDEDLIIFDGAERKLEYEQGSPRGLLPRRPRGLSLQLNAFAQRNNATIDVFGGISLPFFIRVKDNKPEFVIKQQFFTEKELSEGLKIAVKQLTGQLEYQK